MSDQSDRNEQRKLTKRTAIALSLELGYIIAIPILVFGLLGKAADVHFGTDPWLTLIGIFLAIATTTIWLTKRLQAILKVMREKDNSGEKT